MEFLQCTFIVKEMTLWVLNDDSATRDTNIIHVHIVALTDGYDIREILLNEKHRKNKTKTKK